MKTEHAIRWIAENDEPTLTDPEVIKDQLTVVLVADVSGVTPLYVAKLVIEARI